MRIGALSRSSGVSVATIKFYVREGLLPAGTPTSAPNQVEYDDSHLRRLILLRALIEVGGLSLATTRNAVKRLEFRTATPRDVLLTLLAAPEKAPATTDDAADLAERALAHKTIGRLLRDRGWQDAAGSGPAADLVHAVTALQRLGHDVSESRLAMYADAAEKLTKRERVAHETEVAAGTAAVESALVEAVILGSVLTSMRQLAHLRVADEPAPVASDTSRKKSSDRTSKKRAKNK